jgi:hypothetical protein
MCYKAPGVEDGKSAVGGHAETQRAFQALVMQIDQILHPQDDVTQFGARHA